MRCWPGEWEQGGKWRGGHARARRTAAPSAPCQWPRKPTQAHWLTLQNQRYPPFYDTDVAATYSKAVDGRFAVPPHFSPAARDLVKRLLHAG